MKKQINNNNNNNVEIELLQNKVEQLEFDLLWQKTLAEKKTANTVVTINHNHNVNDFLYKKDIDVKNDSMKDIVRKIIFRNINVDNAIDYVKQAYSLKEDRSKSQKENKQKDAMQYAEERLYKISNDILKEDFAIAKFDNKRLTAIQLFGKMRYQAK